MKATRQLSWQNQAGGAPPLCLTSKEAFMLRRLLQFALMNRQERPFVRKLKKMGACDEAVRWARQFGSMEEAWQACERADWMLFYAGRMCGRKRQGPARKKLALAACACAEAALHPIRKVNLRLSSLLLVVKRWALGRAGVSLADVERAAYASFPVQNAAYHAWNLAANYPTAKKNVLRVNLLRKTWEAGEAVNSAASVAYAAQDSWSAACAAASAAFCAASSLDYPSGEGFWRCAKIVRTFYPDPPLKETMRAW